MRQKCWIPFQPYQIEGNLTSVVDQMLVVLHRDGRIGERLIATVTEWSDY